MIYPDTALELHGDYYKVKLFSQKELVDEVAKKLRKPILQYWREKRVEPSRDYRRTLYCIDGFTVYSFEDECWYSQEDNRLVEDPSLEDVEGGEPTFGAM